MLFARSSSLPRPASLDLELFTKPSEMRLFTRSTTLAMQFFNSNAIKRLSVTRIGPKWILALSFLMLGGQNDKYVMATSQKQTPPKLGLACHNLARSQNRRTTIYGGLSDSHPNCDTIPVLQVVPRLSFLAGGLNNQEPASRASILAFNGSPPPNSPGDPSLLITRWQGMKTGYAFLAMVVPTNRAARGRPASRATWP